MYLYKISTILSCCHNDYSKRFEIYFSTFIDWTTIPYDVGYAIVQWIYTNEKPTGLQNTENLTELDSHENDSFVLTLMKTAKSFNLKELINRCEESLLARVQVIILKFPSLLQFKCPLFI